MVRDAISYIGKPTVIAVRYPQYLEVTQSRHFQYTASKATQLRVGRNPLTTIAPHTLVEILNPCQATIVIEVLPEYSAIDPVCVYYNGVLSFAAQGAAFSSEWCEPPFRTSEMSKAIGRYVLLKVTALVGVISWTIEGRSSAPEAAGIIVTLEPGAPLAVGTVLIESDTLEMWPKQRRATFAIDAAASATFQMIQLYNARVVDPSLPQPGPVTRVSIYTDGKAKLGTGDFNDMPVPFIQA